MVFTPHTGAASNLVERLLATSAGLQVDPASIALRASAAEAVQLYDGSITALGIGAGLLLTSGQAPGLVNDIGWDGQDNSAVSGIDNGDSDVDAVVNTVFQTQSFDATALEFSFTATDPSATSVSLDIVFGSEEFPEWVDQFVDCAVVMVNGVNYALFNHDPNHPLSVVTPNLNAGYFQDNATGVIPLQYDGISRVLTIIAPIRGNGATNHIKIGIADTGDHIYDSGLFIAGMRAGHQPGSGVVTTRPEGSTGDDLVTGSVRDEYFDLQSGNDTVYAGAGDDVIVAGAGNDHLYGGSGADALQGDAGDDLIDGGADLDTAIFSDDRASYTVGHTAQGGVTLVSAADGSDALVGIEYVRFRDGLYALHNDTLVPVDVNPPPPANHPGSVLVSGVAMGGKTLTALIIDADGFDQAAGRADYRWQRWSGSAWEDTGTVTRSCVLSADDVGRQLRVVVDYDDRAGNAEQVTSAAVTVAQTSPGITISPMVIEAPAGATVMNPFTTLISNAVALGYTPAEASLAIRQVLGVDPTLALATFDAYAILSQTPGDAVALTFMKQAMQVAMTASVSDPTGMNMTLAVFAAAAEGRQIDLTDTADLLGVGVDAASLGVVWGLNTDIAEAQTYDKIGKVWNDWAGQKDNLKPFLDHIEKLSVHVNQAPVGLAEAELSTPHASALDLTQSLLLAGFSDPDGGVLQASGLTLDQGGSLQAHPDGTWTFVPAPDFSGPVELSYVITDGQGATVKATCLLVVQAPPPDHPAQGILSVSGVAEEGGQLVAALDASDSDGALTVAYQWQVRSGDLWVDLVGANAAALAIAADQSLVGRQVRATAVSTDPQGGTTLFTGTPLPIANVNDLPTGSVTVSGTARQGQVLTASHTLVDEDGLGVVSYQWQARDSTNAAWSDLSSGPTLSLTAALVGQQIRVVAAYSDGQGTPESVASTATAGVAPSWNTVTGSAGKDTLNGTAGDDLISGLAGNDLLNGNAGQDTLDGGSGADTLFGGAGNDTYVVDSATDKVYETAKATSTADVGGVDTVLSSVTWTLGNFIENLTLTGTAAINGTGNGLGNGLVGNAAANTLNGGAGADTLRGLAGDDVYVVDQAGDLIVEQPGEGIDTVQVLIATAGGTFTLAEQVDNAVLKNTVAFHLNGNGLSNLLMGNASTNRLDGGAGDDTLGGLAGNDVLLGGEGIDRLVGGNGNDTLTGGAGADVFVFDVAPSKTGNLDTLTDFLASDDTLLFSKAVFKAFAKTGPIDAGQFWSAPGATAGHDADDRFVYNPTTGALYYDADGSAKTVAAVQVAVLGTATHPQDLTYADFSLLP